MNGRRVGALVLAIVLVVGAYVVRTNVIDDDTATTDDTEVTEPEDAIEEATVLYCITELTDACEALAASHDLLDITIEDAGVTLDRLAALEDGEMAPLWITIEPYPAMVDLMRQNAQPRRNALGFETEAVGASQLAVAFRVGDKAAAIAEFCEEASMSLWRCIGEQTDATWETLGAPSSTATLRPSLGDVAGSALGLTSFGSATASYFGAADVDRTQYLDTAFTTWLRRLSRRSVATTQVGSTPLAALAVRAAPDAAATAMFEVNVREREYDESRAEATESSIDAADATESSADTTEATDAPEDRFDVNYSDPEMWIQAVIATPAGVSAPSDLATDVASALADAGWDPASAADGSLPSASTLLALRQLWIDYT